MIGAEIKVLQNPNWTWASIKSLVDSNQVSKSIVPFLIVLHLAVTLILAYLLNIWVDEAFSLHTTGQDVKHALKQAIQFELQAPLYFVVLSIWRKIDSSIFFARLFSVLCIALTIKVVASLSQRFLKQIHPGWIAAVVAFNPFIIWIAVEIRGYALAVLLSALLLLFFFDGYLSEVPRTSARLLYILLSIAALYTQYYLGYLLLANAFPLLLLRRWRSLYSYLISMVIVGLCFAPMLFIVFNQVADHTQTVRSTIPLFEVLGIISLRIPGYVLPAKWLISIISSQWVLRLSLYVLVSIGFLIALVLVIKNRRRITSSHIALWGITAILALCFTITLKLIGEEELVLPRHTGSLFLPTLLSAFSIITVVARKNILIILTLATLVFNIISIGIWYTPMAKYGDWNRVATYIMSSEKPGQPILVFAAENALPLAHYYSGYNRLVPLPKVYAFDSYNISGYALRDEKEITKALSSIPGNQEQIWLVTAGGCHYLNVDYNCWILEDFINSYYSVESTKTFFKSEVRLLSRKTKNLTSPVGVAAQTGSAPKRSAYSNIQTQNLALTQ